MAFVQRPHGRHETQRAVLPVRHAAHLLHPRYGANDFHFRLVRLKSAHGRKGPDRWKVASLPVGAASPQFVRDDMCYGSRHAATTAKAAASTPRLTFA